MNAKKSDHFQCRQISNDHEQYYEEERRLETFSNWPAHYPVNPSRLAKSGFYYSGNEDEVTCFSCGGCIRHWQFGDIVQKRHMELYPHCSFINNKSNNVALVNTNAKHALERIAAVGSSSDVCGTYNLNSNGYVSHGNSDDSSNFLANAKERLIYSEKINSKYVQANSSRPIIEIQKMASLEERLKSFNLGWTVLSPSVQDLAMAGFFFLGDGDKVQCAFCWGIVKDWESKDIPLSEHARHFPECKYVRKLLDQKSSSTSHPQFKGNDVCGSSVEESQSLASRSPCKLIDKSQHMKLKELGINLHSSPAHPYQSTLAARLQTFLAWPSSVPVSKESLAAAGFFYIGISDYTKCFQCDGGLCSWEPDDDPWVEHARWFQNCSFLRLNKDEAFIKKCTKLESPADSKQVIKEQQSHPPEIYSSCSGNVLTCKLEEAMKSSLIATVIKTGIYPPYLIRAAVFQQLKDNGIPFANVDEVCHGVNLIKAKIKATSTAHNQEKKGKILASHTNKSSCENSESSERNDEKSDSQVSPHSGNEDSKLENENIFLKDQRLCKICMDNDVSVVFLPCGHLLACTLCAPALNYCPMCRQSIQATVRAYLP